jgi:glycyl-tRNA synthetase beta chain
MTGYRRAANILRAEEKSGESFKGDPDDAFLVTEHDERLAAAITGANAAVASAVEAEDYRQAMEAIAALRGPVDAFFDNVRVNDENRDVRMNRLRLLAALREVTRQVADFSQIPG